MGRKSGRTRGRNTGRGIFEQWRQSEMTQRTFCLEKQLSYTTFYYWYRKLILKHGSEKKSAGRKQARLPLAEVVLVETDPGPSPMNHGVDQGGYSEAARYEISLPRGPPDPVARGFRRDCPRPAGACAGKLLIVSLPPSVRIFVCLVPTDLRRSFDGLAGLVRESSEKTRFQATCMSSTTAAPT